jgi:subtilisin family serine protease
MLGKLPVDLASCSTFEKCADNQRSKLWAQERVDADLMQAELARMGVNLNTVNVAVIDTGFDTKGLSSEMQGTVTVKKGVDQAGEPAQDTEGHGSAVASLIGGKSGVGVAAGANLTVYRNTPANSANGSPNSYLKISLEKACADGNEIINLSWGSVFDETGAIADEEAEKDFIKSLRDRGCLVIKAAGNGSARNRNTSKNDPDDAYLRVAATRTFWKHRCFFNAW